MPEGVGWRKVAKCCLNPDSISGEGALKLRHLTRDQLAQNLEVAGKGFIDTSWIFNFDTSSFQAHQGKTHRHSVVIIGFNFSWLHLGSRLDSQTILKFLDFDPQPLQFGYHSRDAVGLLPPAVFDVTDGGWTSSKRGDGG